MNRKLLIGILVAAMCVSLAGPSVAKKKKSSGPVVVFEDPAGDAGNNNTGPIPGIEQGGFDLTKGTILAKGSDLVFSAEHAAMPAGGSLPEGFRLLWHFSVDGEEYRFTVKSADVGKPDALAQSGEDRIGDVDTDGVFRLEQCADEATGTPLTLVNCNVVEKGYLEGAFEPSKASVTWLVPMELVGAHKGSVVAGGTTGAASSSCQICWVPHYAERSLTPHTIIDSATMLSMYKVP